MANPALSQTGENLITAARNADATLTGRNLDYARAVVADQEAKMSATRLTCTTDAHKADARRKKFAQIAGRIRAKERIRDLIVLPDEVTNWVRQNIGGSASIGAPPKAKPIGMEVFAKVWLKK